MPVDDRTRQPFGILHGGASVALAETVASLGAVMNVDLEKASAVGLEINANHLRAKRDGVVRATATPFHVGRSTQVWDVRIVDEEERPVCISRCTLAVVPVSEPVILSEAKDLVSRSRALTGESRSFASLRMTVIDVAGFGLPLRNSR